MTLQKKTVAPGKARRAAKNKPRHTTAQKAAAKKASPTKKTGPARGSAAAAASKTSFKSTSTSKPSTKRYSDADDSVKSKKQERVADRSKLRAQRFQAKTASKSKEIEGAPKGNPRQTREERTFDKTKRKPVSRASKFVSDRNERTERKERDFVSKPRTSERPARTSDRPVRGERPERAGRDNRAARIDRAERAPRIENNFVPRKKSEQRPERPNHPFASKPRVVETHKRPVRDRRNDAAAYSEDHYKSPKRFESHVAQDFGADDNYISTNLADANLIDATPNSAVTTTFRDLGVTPAIVNALSAQGITTPFPIQVATLPDALAGHDILGRGQTGSGKTLAFSLALLTNIANREAKPHKPLALILTPTRELAQQIDEVLRPLARAIGHESVVVAGGMAYSKQITAMRRGTAILVATPGRLIDLLNKGEVQLDHLEITVLDEADQMADMGFLPVVKEILDQGKMDGQRLLFSATLDRGVDALVKQYLKNPKTHSLQNDRASVSTMEHYVLVMHPGDKDDITSQIAARNGKTILFVKTQRGADRLADKLAHAGVPVGALHGGKSQAVRTRTLQLFKDSENHALVATDVAARGIHVDGISLVVHVDPAQDHKDYLHRSGRTARAGESGVVVSLAPVKQRKAVGGLTTRAGVAAKFVDVRPLDQDLMKITGAQEPSGIPYVAPIVEAPKRPQRSGGNRRPRPNSAQRRRRPH